MESKLETLPFLVSEFDRNLISLLIKQCFGASFPDIKNKKQTNYLINYLQKLDAKTVICETEYIDRYYLEDFSKYYVSCFSNYSSSCARLHFFSEDFTHDDFCLILESESPDTKKLQSSYLGFVVVKPLPLTFIGRTCLKIYNSLSPSVNSNKRCISKKYYPNLFGISLEVESIAFQEQDKVVSACATTALWTLFHAMDYYPVQSIPSPSEITLDALSDIPYSINGFPNKGLTQIELLRAMEIRKVKQHELSINSKEAGSLTSLSNNIKIYIDSNLPILLGCKVYSEGENGLYFKGYHAVTLLGYKYTGKTLSSIYLHDDRVGPYCEAKTVENSNNELDTNYYFSLSLENDSLKNDVLIIESLIIGSYHKVRIPAQLILYTCESIVEEFDFIVKSKPDNFNTTRKIDFDIKLAISSDLKKEYIENKIQNKRKILTTHWPKYVWKASFKNEEGMIFDFIYDATDIPQGPAIVDVVIFNDSEFKNFKNSMLKLYEDYLAAGDRNIMLESFFIQTLSFLRSLKEKPGYFEHLDKTYGDLRPPKYIKNTEFQPSGVNKQDESNEFFDSTSKTLLSDICNGEPKIWVVTKYGGLIIGNDSEEKGHPTLTGAEPARVAGEIFKKKGCFYINAKSGRYSHHYAPDKLNIYLNNAISMFKEFFPNDKEMIYLSQ